MKKLLAVLTLLLIGAVSYAQWLPNGNHIYNSNTGYVGIGGGVSFTPTENLHVRDLTAPANIAVESSYTGSGSQVIGRYRIRNNGTGDQYYIGLRTTSGVREAIQSVRDGLTGTWREFIYVNLASGKYEFRNGITDAEFMNNGKILFNNTGAIGIGMGTTAIPSGAKLAVAGKVVCKEVEVTLTGFPDFVFHKDYNLMPLSEVEAFISVNKHLPGVPSEKEIVANGLNLGQMDALLMQKIEELTLYLIDLKKENESLKAKLEAITK